MHTPITTTLPTPVLSWCSSRQSSYCHGTHTRTHTHTHTLTGSAESLQLSATSKTVDSISDIPSPPFTPPYISCLIAISISFALLSSLPFLFSFPPLILLPSTRSLLLTTHPFSSPPPPPLHLPFQCMGMPEFCHHPTLSPPLPLLLSTFHSSVWECQSFATLSQKRCSPRGSCSPKHTHIYVPSMAQTH